jgi:hypothetical protein
VAKRGPRKHGTFALRPAFTHREVEIIMRLLFGIILGACLTVGGGDIYESHNALEATGATASTPRPLVNWDIVSVKWDQFAARARTEWNRLAG